MSYVALEFDHRIAQPTIRWIVVNCAGVGEKCGGPIALAPRHDVAYFLDPDSAHQDARDFAAYKNSNLIDEAVLKGMNSGEPPARHYAYLWDHFIFSSTLRWGVLQWSGIQGAQSARIDVAYFVDPVSAEHDAKYFAYQRDHSLGGARARA